MEIHTIEKADEGKAAAVLAAAFAGNPLYLNAVADAQKRERFLKEFLKFRVKFGARGHFGRITEDGSGVAVWLAPGYVMQTSDVLKDGGLFAMLHAGKSAMNAMMSFNNFTEKVEKENCPGAHWHLSPLGVLPAAQGKGLGSALLRDGLQIIDERREDCFLETQTQEACRLYQKFGFEVVCETTVPDTDIPHIAMYRKPQK